MEFILKSSKIIFRFANATPEELEVYRQVIDCKFDDLRELFLPFYGEDGTYFNPDIGVDELRIRYWQWNHDGVKDLLMDVNAWPGDNESGIIALKVGKRWLSLASNSDTHLYMKIPHAFEKQLELFSCIRQGSDACPSEDENIAKKIDKYFQSSSGKKAIRMEQQARDTYRKSYDDIQHLHDQLANDYLSEFTISAVERDLEYLDRIGYLNIRKSMGEESNIIYRKITWKNYQLVFIDDHYYNYIYLIDNGLIEIMNDGYLVPLKDDPLLNELRKRSFTLNKIITSKSESSNPINLFPKLSDLIPSSISLVSNPPISKSVWQRSQSNSEIILPQIPKQTIPLSILPQIPKQTVPHPPIPQPINPKLSFPDMVVVFSGFRDPELKSRIEEQEGRVTTAISGKTTLVLIKNSSNKTGKVIDAETRGISVMLKEDFIQQYF